MTEPLPPALRRRPFTVAQAAAQGVGRGRLYGPACQPVHRGVYAPSELPLTLSVRVVGALLVLPPPTVVTGVTGLHLWGVTIGNPEPLTFASTSSAGTRRSGVHVIRVHQLPAVRGRWATPESCFAMASDRLSMVDLVAAGDWLVRLGKTTVSALVASAANQQGRGCQRARSAAALVRTRVDSPRETRLRLCLVMAGLPEPATNVEVGDDTHWIARVDLALLAYRVLLEYEGDHHRTDRRQWDYDVRRYEDLTAAGFVVIRVTARRFRDPREVVLATYAHLVENGYDGPPPVFPAAWREQFEASGEFVRRFRPIDLTNSPLDRDAAPG